MSGPGSVERGVMFGTLFGWIPAGENLKASRTSQRCQSYMLTEQLDASRSRSPNKFNASPQGGACSF